MSLREGRRSLIGGFRGLGVTGDGCSAAGWCSAVAMAMAGCVPGRREESGGSDWGGMERGGAGMCAALAKGGGEGLVGVGHGGDGRCSGRRGLGARLWVKERIGGGVPVEAAGESRTEVVARRGGGAGVKAEAEASAAHQDGSGGGSQASRRRRRGGKRSRRRGDGGVRPGGGGGRSSEVATADDRGRREGRQCKEQVRKKKTGQELIYPKGLRYRLVSPTGA